VQGSLGFSTELSEHLLLQITHSHYPNTCTADPVQATPTHVSPSIVVSFSLATSFVLPPDVLPPEVYEVVDPSLPLAEGVSKLGNRVVVVVVLELDGRDGGCGFSISWGNLG
jgi:hypothetical protein